MLRDLKRRGMRAPRGRRRRRGARLLGGGARRVAEDPEQRCWFHKLGNMLDKLPKRLHPRAKRRLHEIMYAETREHAREAITRFADEYGAKYPKAVATLEQDAEQLLTFFDFPAEHWKHLRTSNVIESPFATVRLRKRVTKGAGSRTQGAADGLQAARHGAGPVARLNGAHLCRSSAPASVSWTGRQEREGKVTGRKGKAA